MYSKGLLILLCNVICSTGFAQQFFLNKEPIDSIYIKAHLSAYQFDDLGTTKGKEEHFVLYFDSLQQQYVVSQHREERFEITFRPKNFELKAKKVRGGIRKNVSQIAIQQLIQALQEPVQAHELIYQVDTSGLRKELAWKHFRKVAKLYRSDYLFSRKYTAPEELDSIYATWASPATLKRYLEEEFKNPHFSITTDYANTISLTIKTRKHKYRFNGDYANTLRQPWFDDSPNYAFGTSRILNLHINAALFEMLPKGFLLRESLANEALIKSYTYWCLNKKSLMF